MTTPLAILPDADEAMTAGFARVLAATLRAGDCILLDGPVGAGKTHFARALIRARQDDMAEEVPSPTFTLVQTYDDTTGTQIWHADLYRLTDPSELVELGLDDALSDAITLIEWPDRMPASSPRALRVSLRETSPDRRRISLHGDPSIWSGVARLAEITRFLHDAGWTDARVLPLAGDASVRRYFRVVGDTSAVLMDAPPGSCGPYLAMTDWLRARGFVAPQILAQDSDAGLLLMQDLGDDLVARVLDRDPARTQDLYDRITDLLIDLHHHAPPGFVPALDGPALADQAGLFAEWYVPAVTSENAGGDIAAILADLHRTFCAGVAPVVGLRDFHAENIVWRGHDVPLGLLDFQDAVAVHPAYDLVSVLQDARRAVTPQTEARQIARYIAATGADPDRFRAAYALLGAARNLRIMGIFARLCLRDGKPRYLEFMPRVWDAIRRDVAHSGLAPLARALDGIPAPTPATLERISVRCGQMPPTP